MAGSSVPHSRTVVSSAVGPGVGAVVATLTVTENPVDDLFYNNGVSQIEIIASQSVALGPVANLGVYINGVLRTSVFLKNSLDSSGSITLREAFLKNISFPDDTVIEVKSIAAAAGTTYIVGINVLSPGDS